MRRENPLPPGERRHFQIEEGVEIVAVCHWQPNPTSAPTVLIVHGLEGSIDSNYVIGTGSKAWKRGMNVVRMNMRNCGGTDELSRTLYHSGLSTDIAHVVRILIEQKGLPTLSLVGFSMGGNLVLKCAGEWADDAPPQIRAVVGVSPAMDLAPSAAALSEPRNRIYELKFMRALRKRYSRKRELFPDLYEDVRLPMLAGIWDFDEHITARYSGFNGADDYYARASASRVIDQIRLPTLIIHALDDPFIRVTVQTRAKALANPAITYIETQHGGHCAFIAEPHGYDGRWAEKTAVDFIAEQSGELLPERHGEDAMLPRVRD
ncbi:MAG: alpha/beta fold hydrolase [Acidobacteriales bacterium]|nr:alpha/beta fold hydrolase [Terriglobales bacterium]